MFKWRRRATSPDAQPAAAPPPPPVVEEKEKDKPLPYDLISAQLRILDRNSPLTIFDVGAHHGHTTEQYLENFTQARVIAVEPDRENFAKAAARLAPFGGRVELVRAGLSDSAGTADLYRNAYDMTHSLLELGDIRYYDEPFAALAPEKVDTLTVDSLCAERKIEVVDVLKMDIQGGELKALLGAKDMLSRGAIRLVVLEVNFVPLYRNMPTFWDIADHLRGHGYALQGIYEMRHQPQQPAILRWSDAIFVAPQMQVLPEKRKPPSRIDEALETVGGHPLPAELFANAHLMEDASIRNGQPPLGGQRSALAPVTGAIIDTSSVPYRYSVVLAANPEIVRNLRTGGLVTVEVSVEVIAGELGVVWTDETHYPLETTERYVPAMPAVQRVLVSVPSEKVHRLALRSVTHDPAGTSFKLVGIRAKASR